jgi:hypothetical protein
MSQLSAQEHIVSQNAVPAQPPEATPLVEATPQTETKALAQPAAKPSLRIYGHSHFIYWWPVWAVGYLMALLTYLQGQPHQMPDRELFHPNSNLGVIFFTTLFLVILMTNFTVRGMASGIVILSILFVTVLLAYLNLWDTLLTLVGDLHIHLNLGAYFWFSTALFVTWVISVFVLDHLTYWQVEPGQVTHAFVLGSGSKTYNAQGMMLEKHRSDLFQNWLLGLGSGNLVIRTSGATHEVVEVPNVLFIGWKVEAMERLIAMEPDEPKTV